MCARRAMALGVVCAGLATTGCSFVIVTGAPDDAGRVAVTRSPPGDGATPNPAGATAPEQEDDWCTQSRGPPIADTVIAVPFLGLGLVGFAAASQVSGGWGGVVAGVGLASAAIGTAFAFSASYGYSATSECEEWNERQKRRKQSAPVRETSPSCLSDRECGADRICKAGLCTPPECAADSDCLRARYCINGRCE